VWPVLPTGIAALDEVLRGGLPVGALTELVGPECSGRTSVALKFVAGLTRAGRVCAWIDVSNALDPASLAAAGVDLERLLWVRCGAAKPAASHAPQRFSLPQKYLTPAPAMKGLHGGGCGGHPRGEVKGLAAAVSGLLRPETPEFENRAPRCAEPQRRENCVPPQSPRQPEQSNIPCQPEQSNIPCHPERSNMAGHPERSNIECHPERVPACRDESKDLHLFFNKPQAHRKNAWAQLDQALRATDLVLQAGGFSAIVLDLGGLTPEFASRVPLATWFRYRAAAEKTQASLLLLAQCGCARSSAELSLQLRPGDALRDEVTVFTGMAHSVEVVRRRFMCAADNVVPLRKPPQRADAANWQSRAPWAGVR
jgi:hypothetical protein